MRTSQPLALREVFGSGVIARICHVAPRTVTKWIDSGKLKGWRVPGTKHRRVSRSVLEKFLAEHGMPGLDQASGVSGQGSVEDTAAV